MFCPYCGQDLRVTPSQSKLVPPSMPMPGTYSSTPSKSNRTMNIALIIVGLVIIIIGVLLILMTNAGIFQVETKNEFSSSFDFDYAFYSLPYNGIDYHIAGIVKGTASFEANDGDHVIIDFNLLKDNKGNWPMIFIEDYRGNVLYSYEMFTHHNYVLDTGNSILSGYLYDIEIGALRGKDYGSYEINVTVYGTAIDWRFAQIGSIILVIGILLISLILIRSFLKRKNK